MKKTLIALLYVMFCLSFSANAQTHWLNDFAGTVGTAKIGLTLAATEIGRFERGEDLDCSYFYVSQLKDIDLKCSIDRNGNFIFKELDEHGKTRAVFKGKFLRNQMDRAEGMWTRTGQTRSLPFRMNFTMGVGAENGNRYAQIDAKDPVKFETAVRDFKTAVLKGDKQKVVSQIRYPINVTINGKQVRIRNKTAMLQNYDRVFDKDLLATMSSLVPHNMFAKSTGAMLGGGLVWFWGDGKVIAINN